MAQKIEFVFCHQKPERSFFWKGKQFPVCARCTGIHIGYLTMPLFLFSVIKISLLVSCLCLIPTLVDGLTQAYWNRESNNFLRVSTGFLFGVAVMSLTSISGKFVGGLFC
jgi:uncharacterized membrane protein